MVWVGFTGAWREDEGRKSLATLPPDEYGRTEDEREEGETFWADD